MHSILIETTFTTVGPLSITMPVAQGAQANQWNNYPVMSRGQDDDGNLLRTGYLPASTVRGLLRRSAGLAEMRRRGPGNTTLQQAYSDILGQREDTREETDLIKLQSLRDADPILDLFGSWSVPSRLLVSNFLPAQNVLPEAVSGVRKDLDDTEGALELLGDVERQRFNARSHSNSIRADKEGQLQQAKRAKAKADKSGNTAQSEQLSALIESLTAEVAELKASMGSMANSSRTLTQYYALPAGLKLLGRIVIRKPKPRDLDLLQEGFDAMSLQPVIGAQIARGCGEFTAQFDIYQGGSLMRTVSTGGWRGATAHQLSEAWSFA